MMKIVVEVIAGLIPMVPAVIFFLRQRKQKLEKATNGLLLGLKGFNIVVGLMAAGFGLIWLASPTSVLSGWLARISVQRGIYMLPWQRHCRPALQPSAPGSQLAAPARQPSERSRKSQSPLRAGLDFCRPGGRNCHLRFDHLFPDPEQVV